MVAVSALLDGVGLLLLVPIIDIVIGASANTRAVMVGHLLRSAGFGGRFEQLVILLLCFSVLVALRALGQWKRDIALANLRVGFVEARRFALVENVVAAPWERLSATDHARLNNLVGGDTRLLGGCVFFVMQGAVALSILLCQWSLALLLSPVLAAVAACLMLAAGVALVPHLVRSRALGRDIVETNLDLAASGAHFFAGLKLAVSQNVQDRFAQEFNRTTRVLLGQQVDFLRQQSFVRMGFTVLSSLAAAGAILLGIAILDIRPSILIVFVVLLARMTGPATQLQQGLQQFVNFLPTYEKMKSLEAELRVAQRKKGYVASRLGGIIRFSNISFRHPGGRGGVEDISLVLEPGSFVGVTGPSGSGKSSFADLLVGLNVPQAGTVTVGGYLLTDELREAWRSLVAYAPQETFLFNGTVRRNLEWVGYAANETKLWEALRIAGAEEIVRRLDGGLDAQVGEGGLFLSGGERQRIALARTLLRRAPLLVLDEVTGATDARTEEGILERLLALDWHPAIVLVAHRAESLRLCDRVLVFGNGRIIADRRADPFRVSAAGASN